MNLRSKKDSNYFSRDRCVERVAILCMSVMCWEMSKGSSKRLHCALECIMTVFLHTRWTVSVRPQLLSHPVEANQASSEKVLYHESLKIIMNALLKNSFSNAALSES